jgi:hypothetical protein
MSEAISGSPSGITVILSFLTDRETHSEEQIDIEKLKEKKEKPYKSVRSN